MPYDCVKLKFAWAEQSENYHNSDINRANMISAVTIIRGIIKLPDLYKCRHRISATLWLKRLKISQRTTKRGSL